MTKSNSVGHGAASCHHATTWPAPTTVTSVCNAGSTFHNDNEIPFACPCFFNILLFLPSPQISIPPCVNLLFFFSFVTFRGKKKLRTLHCLAFRSYCLRFLSRGPAKLTRDLHDFRQSVLVHMRIVHPMRQCLLPSTSSPVPLFTNYPIM